MAHQTVSPKPKRAKRRGAYGSYSTPPEVKFWNRVDVREHDQCWPWRGAVNNKGYGTYKCRHFASYYAHRTAYELNVGPIPEGLELDHLCRNPFCVNPSHLEPVTSRENTRRGNNFCGIHARKTHCLKGHPLSGDNLVVLKSGWRRCRTCDRKRMREKYRNTHPMQRRWRDFGDA